MSGWLFRDDVLAILAGLGAVATDPETKRALGVVASVVGGAASENWQRVDLGRVLAALALARPVEAYHGGLHLAAVALGVSDADGSQ